MRFSAQRPGKSRRGLTLVEMLVTVALMLMIMVIIVQIFQSATGATPPRGSTRSSTRPSAGSTRRSART